MLNSLRRRLLVWLIIPLLFLSVAFIITSYTDNRQSSQQIFDKLLVMLAISISEHALSSGGDILTEDVLEMIRNTTNDNLYYKVIGPDAAFVSGYESIPEPPGGIDALKQNMYFYDANYLGQPVRVIAVTTLVNNVDYEGWMTTFVAQTLREREAFVSAYLISDLYRLAIIIVIASILMWTGVTIGLRPLKKLQDSVRQRNPEDLSAISQQNLPVEIDGVVSALNSLLARLSSHLQLTRRFVDNAAHQLRTPVTSLLPQVDMALREAQTEQEYEKLSKIKRSASQLARLTHQLLNLTYAESLSLSEQTFSRIDLADVVRNAISGVHSETISINTQLDCAPVNGIALSLEEIVSNVIDNAIKYAGHRPTVCISTSVSEGRSVLTIQDDGPGIPPEYHEQVLERFFRLSSDTHGSGLGLAIIKEIVASHGGQLKIASVEHASGLQVICEFPEAK